MNPVLWFANRRLDKVPPHFTKCTTPINDDIEFWILTKTYGRYSIILETDHATENIFISTDAQLVYFEDPKEAVLYELRWSGTK